MSKVEIVVEKSRNFLFLEILFLRKFCRSAFNFEVYLRLNVAHLCLQRTDFRLLMWVKPMPMCGSSFDAG